MNIPRFGEKIVKFKDERISVYQESENDMKQRILALENEIKQLKFQIAEINKENDFFSQEIAKSIEKIEIRNLKIEKLKKTVKDVEEKNQEMQDEIGEKTARRKKIQELHEMTTLINNHRRKQNFN